MITQQRTGFFRAILFSALMFVPPAHSVELTFGWRPGMTCEVESRISKQTDGHLSEPLTLRYIMKVGGVKDDALLITAEEPQLLTDKGSPEQRAFFAKQLLATNMPAFRVQRNGDLLGLDNLEDTRRTLSGLYELTLPKPVDQRSLDRVMEIVGSQGFLEHIVNLFWEPTVGSWAGAHMDVHKPLELNSMQEMPLGFPAQIRMTGTAQLLQLAKCARSNVERTCAVLKSTSRVDPEDFKRAVATLTSKYGGSMDPAQSRIDALDIRITIEATTEPEALIPHHAHFKKEVSFSGLEKGQDVHRSASEEYDWLFSCQ